MIDLIHVNGHLIATVLTSRLDAETSVPFLAAVDQWIKAGEQQIVLDLSQVEFLDSSGIWAIVTLKKKLGANGKLVLAGAHAHIRKRFALVQLEHFFRFAVDIGDSVLEPVTDTPSRDSHLAARMGDLWRRIFRAEPTGAQAA